MDTATTAHGNGIVSAAFDLARPDPLAWPRGGELPWDPNEMAGLSLHELAGHLRSRSLSPIEVTQVILERTERIEPHLNAYITLTAVASRRRHG